ncbi:uncharacterized protein LOC120004189 [Tripterygium wilfordii]|uniref:uncharacterized protein LOC120004189 n=1 Tax=Tripterygium wilfordii TaxID=458696 RepID=UPI0018F85EE1|nr:uncharacterized protein LOC120004189 [Tripterygium wilfordii]
MRDLENLKEKILNDEAQISVSSRLVVNNTSKLRSPLSVRRKGRPVTNRKVSKIEKITCRLKANKPSQKKGKVVEATPTKLETIHDVREIGECSQNGDGECCQNGDLQSRPS